MVNNNNKTQDSTNIRIKVKTKKKLEAEALMFGETHNDIIERLLIRKKLGKDQDPTEKIIADKVSGGS